MNNFIKCSNIALKKLFTHIYITNILRAHHMHGEGMQGWVRLMNVNAEKQLTDIVPSH